MKNLTAVCVEKDDSKEYVMHEVSYEAEDGSIVVGALLATDPLDAINKTRNQLKGN